MQNGPSILRSGSEAVSELFEPISKSNIKSFLRPPSGPPPPPHIRNSDPDCPLVQIVLLARRARSCVATGPEHIRASAEIIRATAFFRTSTTTMAFFKQLAFNAVEVLLIRASAYTRSSNLTDASKEGPRLDYLSAHVDTTSTRL
jgi:hypothetical protein